MPIYEYRCLDCDNDFEMLRPMSQDKELGTCTSCGAKAPRKPSVTGGHILKGSGWARDGYAGGGSSGGAPRRPKPVQDTSSLPYVDRQGGLRDKDHNPIDPGEAFGLNKG